MHFDHNTLNLHYYNSVRYAASISQIFYTFIRYGKLDYITWIYREVDMPTY